jgi:hypothetical protein
MEMRPVGAELFQADRHDDADSRFSAILPTRLKTAIKIKDEKYI